MSFLDDIFKRDLARAKSDLKIAKQILAMSPNHNDQKRVDQAHKQSAEDSRKQEFEKFKAQTVTGRDFNLTAWNEGKKVGNIRGIGADRTTEMEQAAGFLEAMKEACSQDEKMAKIFDPSPGALVYGPWKPKETPERAFARIYGAVPDTTRISRSMYEHFLIGWNAALNSYGVQNHCQACTMEKSGEQFKNMPAHTCRGEKRIDYEAMKK